MAYDNSRLDRCLLLSGEVILATEGFSLTLFVLISSSTCLRLSTTASSESPVATGGRGSSERGLGGRGGAYSRQATRLSTKQQGYPEMHAISSC